MSVPEGIVIVSLVDRSQIVIQYLPVSVKERVSVATEIVIVPLVDHIQTVIQYLPVSAQERVSVTAKIVIVPQNMGESIRIV